MFQLFRLTVFAIFFIATIESHKYIKIFIILFISINSVVKTHNNVYKLIK